MSWNSIEKLRGRDAVSLKIWIARTITHQGTGINLFKEINSAIETRDWIMLSDLIEYELSPLLIKEDELVWFIGREKLEECTYV